MTRAPTTPAASRPTKADVTKAADIVLSPRVSAARAFEICARACLAHADANEPLLHVDGPHEALHQFRVGYRRLRSLFSLVERVAKSDPEAARIKAGLRVLTQTFGPARDLDVFRESHTDLTPSDAARLEAARQVAYAAALAHLHSSAWRSLRADLDAWLDRRAYRDVLETRTWSGRPMAARSLRRRHRRILQAGHDLAGLHPHDRHKVRIEAKKVRYGAQFFGSMWPGHDEQISRLEALLSELQDRLGALNDQVTWTSIEVDNGLVDAEPPHVDIPGEIATAQTLIADLAELTPFWSQAGRRRSR